MLARKRIDAEPAQASSHLRTQPPNALNGGPVALVALTDSPELRAATPPARAWLLGVAVLLGEVVARDLLDEIRASQFTLDQVFLRLVNAWEPHGNECLSNNPTMEPVHEDGSAANAKRKKRC